MLDSTTIDQYKRKKKVKKSETCRNNYADYFLISRRTGGGKKLVFSIGSISTYTQIGTDYIRIPAAFNGIIDQQRKSKFEMQKMAT